DAAGGGTQLSGDQVEIGGLAGAVRADDRRQFAGPKAAADSVDRDVAAEADGQIAGFERDGHRASYAAERALFLHLSPPAWRGRIASLDAIRVRGTFRALDRPNLRKQPLTLPSPREERGEGEESSTLVADRNV